MKTLTLRSLAIVLAMIAATALTACSKRNGDNATLGRNGQRQQPGQPGGVHTGGIQANANCQNCGYFYNNSVNDWSSQLSQFLNLGPEAQIGFVAGIPNNQTGVVFRGNVDPMARNGQIQIMVFDSFAQQSGVFVFQLQLQGAPVSNIDLSGNPFRLVFRDQVGEVILDGQFTQNGTYEGQVSYASQGGTFNLGQFITNACGFISGC
jgi:hypothetical protein